MASPVIHDDVCSESTKTITCPENYIIIVHQEHYVKTGNGCNHG